MPDLAAELWAVQHLAALCGMNVTNIRDAKTALGPIERGLDVVFDLDGRRIGAQHTIFHADEGQAPGRRRSLARAKESSGAGDTGAVRPLGCCRPRPALSLRLREKCAIAARHDTRDAWSPRLWLVVSACLNRWGAAASVMIVPFSCGLTTKPTLP